MDTQNLCTTGVKQTACAEYRRGQAQPNHRNNRSRECWICGKVGHFKADCPSRPRAVGKLTQAGAAGRASATPTKQTQKLTNSSERPAVKQAEVSKHLGSYSVASSAAVYAPGQVEGHGVHMLIDTGSAVTLVHRRLLDKVGRSASLHEVRESVVSANGQPLNVLGRCGVRFQLGGVDVIHPVLVAGDITQDCLIGIDFLSKYRCEISFAKNTLKVSGKVTALSKVNVDSVVCGRISLAETVTVLWLSRDGYVSKGEWFRG